MPLADTAITSPNVPRPNAGMAVCSDYVDLRYSIIYEPRGVKIYGTAEMTRDRDGYLRRTLYLKITPRKKWSWGIEAPVFVDGKFVVHRKSAP